MKTRFINSCKSLIIIILIFLKISSTEYQCESDGKYSEVFKFKAISNSSNFSPRLAIYGDLGHENGVSIPQLVTDVKNGLYDAILHIGLLILKIIHIWNNYNFYFIDINSGDIAYNLNKVSFNKFIQF